MMNILIKNLWTTGILLFFFSAATLAHHPSKLLDLSYPFDSQTIYWPTEKGFKLQPLFYGETPEGYFYSAFKFCAPEHGGTHVDAPRHFSKKGLTVDKIPIEDLRGEALVIDVAAKVQGSRDYAFSIEDVKRFEKKYRPIHAGDIVLFYTGWGKYWGDKKNYLGSEVFGDTKHLHFPGLAKETAEYLVGKKVKAIGLDTPSLDPGVSLDFWAHRIILGANIYGIENIANLNKLSPLGCSLLVAPLKIEGGSGGPARIFAFC